VSHRTGSPREAKLFLAVAGWSIAARHATEFPPGESQLERYARRLDAVEINSSFYRSHRFETYARWAASTPGQFRFAVKAPRTVTHEHRLVGCATLLGAFADELRGLGAKLGVVLVQLPPSLAFDQAVAERFLSDFRRRIAAPLAIEPRHPSWFTPETDRKLADWRVARVAADPPIAPSGGRPGGYRDLRYYRWHGSPHMYHSDYGADALVALKAELEEERKSCDTIWCVFDNTASGAALKNALTMTSLKPQRERGN
jgi:uncharacterized protein YecE (DUF72 family)